MNMESILKVVVTIILIDGFYAASMSGIDTTLQTDPTGDRHHHYHRITLKHFSEHALCSNTPGTITFLKALEDYFLNISDTMRVNFILDLCSRRGDMLIGWVREIFDKDGDGYISHFERIFYNNRRLYGEGIWINNLSNDV
ncbi:uncharacterized protein LOC128240092 [Mya arenaria]|uniref:uncharacterized protein LOC128240092 n=1 Tax=Mya arenaria TaxID=6604 RepID=UPI0022E3BB2B|nr:uncharacterized protein LOC128240092 [Mya arenaria]